MQCGSGCCWKTGTHLGPIPWGWSRLLHYTCNGIGFVCIIVIGTVIVIRLVSGGGGDATTRSCAMSGITKGSGTRNTAQAGRGVRFNGCMFGLGLGLPSARVGINGGSNVI